MSDICNCECCGFVTEVFDEYGGYCVDCYIESQASTIATLEARVKELEAALTRIANPIKAFIEDAEKDGCKLDGHAAISLAKDAEILKQWATSALSSANSIGDCGCRFESEDSNTVILCDECSKLPCHNPTQQD